MNAHEQTFGSPSGEPSTTRPYVSIECAKKSGHYHDAAAVLDWLRLSSRPTYRELAHFCQGQFAGQTQSQRIDPAESSGDLTSGACSNFAYSTLACFRIGISGSASFQIVKKAS
jgi:hypothetical protein